MITSAPAGQGTSIKCFIYLKNDIVLKLCAAIYCFSSFEETEIQMVQ